MSYPTIKQSVHLRVRANGASRVRPMNSEFSLSLILSLCYGKHLPPRDWFRMMRVPAECVFVVFLLMRVMDIWTSHFYKYTHAILDTHRLLVSRKLIYVKLFSIDLYCTKCHCVPDILIFTSRGKMCVFDKHVSYIL